MKNMLKLFAIIYFVGSIVVALASAITYMIAVSRLIKVFAADESEELDKIEISENEIYDETEVL